jgi:hypothetical protein
MAIKRIKNNKRIKNKKILNTLKKAEQDIDKNLKNIADVKKYLKTLTQLVYKILENN